MKPSTTRTWGEVTFDVIVEDSAFGPRFSGEAYSDDGNILSLRTTDISTDGRISYTDMPRAKLDENKFSNHFLQPGDLVITRSGRIGTTALFEGYPEPVLPGAFLIRFRLNDKADELFFRYWFNSRIGQHRLLSVARGVAQQNINITNVKGIMVPLPSLEEQRRIASILSAYDDLIQNNRRRIMLLEEAVRLLHREWFVHLRFPGHETTPIVDGVPEGWEMVPLSELCTDLRESVDPKTLPTDTAYIGLEHIPRRSITLSEWGTAGEIESSKFKFSEGDILFGKIRPYFHKVGFALVDGIASSDAVVVRPHGGLNYHYVLALLSSDQFVDLASKTVREGSKMPRADWKYLLKVEFKRPASELLTLFNSFVAPICVQLQSLALQNKTLAKARDLLLPRLMNGEVTV